MSAQEETLIEEDRQVSVADSAAAPAVADPVATSDSPLSETQVSETQASQTQASQTQASTSASTATSLPSFSIRLEFFSGPMDLLLHLVSQQEVPIEQVKMSIITEQYLEIVSSSAESLDLELASEYLVIAATLMAIKSRSLLPIERNIEEEQTEEEDWEANRFFEDLRSRLIAYEATKKRAACLMQAPQLGYDTFRREDRKALQPTPEMLAESEDLHSFTLLFAKLLKRIGGAGKSFRIALEPISIVSSMMSVIEILGKGKDGSRGDTTQESLSFKSLFKKVIPLELLRRVRDEEQRQQALGEAKGMVIGSFIASLELIKRGVLSAEFAEDSTGQRSEEFSLRLQIDSAEDPFDSEGLVSEFDEVATGNEVADTETTSPEEDQKVVAMSKYRTSSDAQQPTQEQEDERSEEVSEKEVIGG